MSLTSEDDYEIRLLGRKSLITGALVFVLLAIIWSLTTSWYRENVRETATVHLEHRASSLAFELTHQIDVMQRSADSMASPGGVHKRIVDYLTGDEEGLGRVAERFDVDRQAAGFDSLYIISDELEFIITSEQYGDRDRAMASSLIDRDSIATTSHLVYPEQVGDDGSILVAYSTPLSTEATSALPARLVVFYDIEKSLATYVGFGADIGEETVSVESSDGVHIWGDQEGPNELSAKVSVGGDSGWLVRYGQPTSVAMRDAWTISWLGASLALTAVLLVVLLVNNIERARSQAKVEKAAREKTQRVLEAEEHFIASMSHEFRTPLNSMIGFSHIMLEGDAGELTEEQERQIGMIQNSSKRLLTLVNSLLDFSRIRSDCVEVSPVELEVAGVIEWMQHMFAPLIAEKGLEARFADNAIDSKIITDKELLGRALINLLGNAVKFTDEGFVGLHVSIDGERISFVVTDSGKGIPADEIDNIVREFRRVPGNDPSTPGTGLGLPITKELAALLGGELLIESSLGEGSKFTLKIASVLSTDEL